MSEIELDSEEELKHRQYKKIVSRAFRDAGMLMVIGILAPILMHYTGLKPQDEPWETWLARSGAIMVFCAAFAEYFIASVKDLANPHIVMIEDGVQLLLANSYSDLYP